MVNESLNSKVLGQLLLMQSYINNLPNKKSIFSFVCQGLKDIPGISHVEFFEKSPIQEESEALQVSFPVLLGSSMYGDIIVNISEYDLFKPYETYIKNFIFMIAVVLEERHQRELNKNHQVLLEQRILERTQELTIEKENLIESQRRFSDLMINVQLLSVMINSNGTIIFCNNYLCSLTEYSSDEIMGKNWFDVFIEKQNVDQVKVVFKGLMNGDDFAYNYENGIITKSGKRLIISWNNTILYDGNKNRIGTASIGENITVRKQIEFNLKEKSDELEAQNEEYRQLNEELHKAKELAEKREVVIQSQYQDLLTTEEEIRANNEALVLTTDALSKSNEELQKAKEQAEESEHLIRNITDNIPAYIAVVNIETLQYKFVNKKFISSFKKTREEIIGSHISNIIGKENTEFAMKYINDVRKGISSTYINTFEISEETRYVQVNYVPSFNDKNEITDIIVLSNDITEIKQSEIELQKAKEQAEQSDRLKTAFLQNMSHEIRTPMNAIMGFSNLLSNSFNDKSKLEKYSKIITQRCSDLLDLINDILDIAKIESGLLSVNIEACTITEIYSDLSSFFTEYQKRMNNEHISLNLKEDTALFDVVVQTDQVKVKQILINLIGNAFKFTETGCIESGCKYDDKHNLLFYVSDTGKGIPVDKQAEVFERFSQLDPGANKLVSGTGLGLSIVKGLVSLLGGQILLESEVGKGTTFTFSIPLISKPIEAQPAFIPEKNHRNSFPNKTILIVEDDHYNAEYLKEILSELNVTILHSFTGNDAIMLSRSQSVDLVLMDIRLPDIDGYEATRQLHQHKSNIQVIAQTAYASLNEKQKALESGCIDYISKPTKREHLIEMVCKHLSVKKSFE